MISNQSMQFQANAHRATQRDDVQGIGPEGYAEYNTNSYRRIANWSLEPSPSPRELEAATTKTNTTSRETTTPTTGDDSATPKRPASTQPVEQPNSKRTKLSTPSPTPRRYADLASKRRALTQPADQPARKKARIFIPLDASGGDCGFDEAPLPPTQYPSIAEKLLALAERVRQPNVNRDRVFVPSDRSGGRGGFDEMLSPFSLEVAPTLRAPTGLSGGDSSKLEQTNEIGAGDKGKAKFDKAKVETSKADKDKVDSDSDGLEIIEAKSTPVSKTNGSSTARSASARKSIGRQSEQLETPATEASPSARKSTVKASNARGKSVSQAVDLDDSEAAGDEHEEEDDDDVSEHEDPQVLKKRIIQADKNISTACRNCKINANREWKDKYNAMVSKLNNEHKVVVRTLKADAIAATKKAKATADKEKKAAKAKADKEVADVKETLEDKYDCMKAKLEGEIKTLKKNLAAEKGDVASFKEKLDQAAELRKQIEKKAADTVKRAEADLKAGELKQKEKWKHLKREASEEANRYKPEHAKLLKEKERNIKELTQKILDQEKVTECSEDDLRRAREERTAEKSRHNDTRKHLAEARASDEERQRQILQYQSHCKRVEERAQTHVARVEEQLATVNANLKQQSNRIVDKQRENYLIQDALRVKADLAEARKGEIEGLKKQLRDAQAELRVAVGIEEMDVVEVVKGEVVKGEGVKGEGVKGEGVKGEGVKGETAETK